MPPETPSPPGLHSPHGLSRWFFRHMCLHPCMPHDLGTLSDTMGNHGNAFNPGDAYRGWRDAATLLVCKGLICRGLYNKGVEMWPKNGCVSTPLLNCYLIISELRIRPWPRPDWFVFFIYNFIVILLCDINIFCNFAVNQYSYGDAGGCRDISETIQS